MAIDPTCVPTGRPAWSREAAIGDYGGATDKEDCSTEAVEPYAAAWLRDLRSARGSAYTQKDATLVDAENVALARHFAAVWSRNPEKLRANATPLRADERLEYWCNVLAVPMRDDEQRWQRRQNANAVYVASAGPTCANVTATMQALLGDAFVAVHTTTGTDLDTPPTNTYWPGVNPGDDSYSLGGGQWSSPRCHLWVEVQWPAGMSIVDFNDLIHVRAPRLLDPLLPAHATFSVSVGGGFILGTSLLGYTGLTET